MPGNSTLPFSLATTANTGVTDTLAGISLLDAFMDSRGRQFRLYQVPTTLTGTNTASGDACYLTVPATMTNTVANATGSSTTLIHAGAAPGIIIPSTASITYYTLLLTRGRMTVNTTSSTGAAGDYLKLSTTNAKYTFLLQADTTTVTGATSSQDLAGRMLAAETGGTVDAWVNSTLSNS